MANCDVCGKKLGLMGGVNLQNKVHNTLIGPQITVCDSCEKLMTKLKNGDSAAYYSVHALVGEKPIPMMEQFLSFWEVVPKEKREEEARKAKEAIAIEAERNKEIERKSKKILVTTGDIHQPYDIIGPVYFQVSNKGLFGSSLGDLMKKYYNEIQEMKSAGTMSEERMDWGFLLGAGYVGQNEFESAFYIAVQELKKRAAIFGGDAVIYMRQDIDMDTTGFQFFYLQMYGTVVKFR